MSTRSIPQFVPKKLGSDELGIVALTSMSLSLTIGWVYFTRVVGPLYGDRLVLHNEIIKGIAVSPYNTRVLVPFLAEALRRLFSIFYSDNVYYFNMSYRIVDIIGLFCFLSLSYFFFRRFYASLVSMIGMLFIGGVIHIALQDHGYQPWSVCEGGFFALALTLIAQNKVKMLWLLTAVATLNRETGLLIPALLIFHESKNLRTGIRKDAARAIVLSLLAWVTVFFLLRYFRPSAKHAIDFNIWVTLNTSVGSLKDLAFNLFMFMGLWWLILVIGLRHSANSFINKSWLILIIYLPLVIIFGVWKEVRLLLPLYPLLIATCLSVIEKRLSDR